MTDLVERLWYLHRRGLSYASDTPAVNLLLADLSEGIKQAAEGIAYLNDWLAEIQMNAHKWMEAHDKLKAGKPYDLPKTADLPDTIEALSERIAVLEGNAPKTKCALALFDSLSERGNRYAAVKVDGPLNWTITEPRTQEALLAALETE
jgi:hypothetical protein